MFGTTFQNPVLLAAGTAGFGREVAGVIDIDSLGGIITKAVSPEPRAGHSPPRLAEFGGGMLNAVGLANPGVEFVASRALPWLARHVVRARTIVNVVGSTVDDFVLVVRRLEGDAVVTAFELNVSCPNTERDNAEFGSDPVMLSELVAACRAVTRKPLIVKLAPNHPDLPGTAEVAAAQGADGFTLVNTVPGALARFDASGAHPRLGFGRGGVSGPSLLAIGVLATQLVAERTSLPVIGLGGVRTSEDVQQYLRAGARLVAVGTAALADPRVPNWLAKEWSS